MPHGLPASLSWLVFVAVAAAQHDGVTPSSPSPKVDFARSVQPILAQHCYACHGPDEQKRKGKLRLDRRDDAFAEHEDGAPFVAGKPESSQALLRIESDDDEERMPPPDHGERLKPAEIELLRRWLAEGTPWTEHWSFVKPVRPAAPAVSDASWSHSDLDRFVLARLEHEGMHPSPEASREQWLRRVTFDLIGVPPTIAELDAFEHDSAPDAFEKVVDRLLADARYGEHQASGWLDVARYADSSGYQRDTPRVAWKWRDWVIDAFNQNMPFDQFTIEQLAGDLLPNPTLEQRIATGFNRNHPVNTEAGEELDEYRSAYVIDRVHTTATTWLGLSIGCAQCHDHKYDPISQRDYYSFYGFFNNIKEKDSGGFSLNPKPSIPAPGPDDVPRLADLERRQKVLEQRLDRDDPLADEAQAGWEKATLARLGEPIAWTTLAPTEFMARHGSRLQRLDDGSMLASGPVPVRDTYDLVFVPGKRSIQALRLEVLPDPSMPEGASGRADDGRFILSRLESRLSSVADSSDPPLIAYALAAADVNQKEDEDEHYLTAITPGDIAGSIAVDDGAEGKGGGGFRFGGRGWSIAGDERKAPREAILIPIDVLQANDTSMLRLTLDHTSANKFRSMIGRFRVSFTEDPRVRTQLLPLASSLWHSIGPFPAATVADAWRTGFSPEKELTAVNWKQKHEQPVVEVPKPAKEPAKESAKESGADADGKPAQAKPVVAKVTKEPKDPSVPLADADEAKAPADAKTAAKAPSKPKAKPKRLEWEEQRSWRDGEAARLAVQGAASAWFVSRRVHCDVARTATIEFDGGVGAKLWLNGTLVGDYAPPPDVPDDETPKPSKEDFDEQAFFAMRARGPEHEPRRLRLGLRAGDNHLVVKLIGKGAPPRGRGAAGKGKDADEAAGMGAPPGFGMSPRGNDGGITFTFTMNAEGDDLLDYETAQALRAKAGDVAAVPAVAAEAVAKPTAAGAAETIDKKPKTPAERRAKVLRRWFRTHIDIAGRALSEELERVKKEKDRVEAKLTPTLVMEELATPRQVHVFVRGDYRHPGDVVDTGTPPVLPPMPAALPKNRLGLAQWLVSPDNPLVARVTVNRAWQQFFGLGLVRTADDFGMRGAAPSHPELLDWLACEFVGSGWNQKQLHRLLVLSATYRQSGFATPDTITRDPDNVLLSRGPHLRLTAEMVRDQALAVAGLLVQKVGGESVKPYQPPGLWRSVLGSGDWKPDVGEALYRRGLYVYWKRGVPYPSFTAFDAAKRETCTVTRTHTTTPLQALVTLNDPVYVEAGRALGVRMLNEGGKDDEARLAFGFRLVASRRPDDQERTALVSLLADLRTHFKADAKAAKLVLGAAEAEPDGKPDGKVDGKVAAKGDTDEGETPHAEPTKVPAKAIEPVVTFGPKLDPKIEPAEAAAWAELGATLLNLEAAIRRG